MTRLFGILGSPISHSLSPVMHNAALRALRLDACYTALETPPRFLAPILQALIRCGVEGLNVTVPLKQAVIPLLDRLDPTAQAMGAVNTIVIHNRRTTGYNTDGIGVARALHELGWRARRARIVILGAGGAARAVAWEVSRMAGSEVVIANRHLARAQTLARWLARQRPRVRVHATSLTHVSLDGAALLINATPVGMAVADAPPIPLTTLSPTTRVYDVIYHHQTALVRMARRRGCVAANGLSMLLYQGAESFRLWLHRAPPLDVMREALNHALHV